MKIDMQLVEDVARDLYIRALKILPDDVKQGFERLEKKETDARARQILGTMIRNIAVAEDTDNLTCQDTGIPIYNVTVGRHVIVDGVDLEGAIARGCARATTEHPFRSSVVHPLTRANLHTSCGVRIPLINFNFTDRPRELTIQMVPKGSGSENNTFLKMATPAEGIAALKTFVIDSVIAAGGKTCPPTIVGVGIGGTADLCVHLAKQAATVRPLGSRCADVDGARLEKALSGAVNRLGIGPQGLGGDGTAFAVHVELAATHITMNPVAINMQCHAARRASARFTPDGVTFGA